MASSHCLICGSVVVSGLYCYNCLWEIRRIRLRGESDLDTWMESNMKAARKISCDKNVRPLETFNSR